MTKENKIATLSICLSLVGISMVLVERWHHGWWPF